jgi:hypothetical protein
MALNENFGRGEMGCQTNGQSMKMEATHSSETSVYIKPRRRHAPVPPQFRFEAEYTNSRPPLWSSGQSSWLQIQMSGSDSRRYQIFWVVVGLERGPLGLSRGSGIEIREYGLRDPSRWPRGTLSAKRLALTSPTSVCRSVGIVRSRTKAAGFVLFIHQLLSLSALYSLWRHEGTVTVMLCTGLQERPPSCREPALCRGTRRR